MHFFFLPLLLPFGFSFLFISFLSFFICGAVAAAVVVLLLSYFSLLKSCERNSLQLQSLRSLEWLRARHLKKTKGVLRQSSLNYSSDNLAALKIEYNSANCKGEAV